MTPERWRDVSRVYGAVLTRPEVDRARALADLCGDDATLRHDTIDVVQACYEELCPRDRR